MTEAHFTTRLLAALRARLPGCWLQKFNDRRTAGIPDFVVVFEGRSTWFEAKLKHGRIAPLQYETLRRIGRAWFVVWDAESRTGSLMRPIRGKVYDYDRVGAVPFHELVARVVEIAKEIDP